MAGKVELGLFQMDEYAGARESDKDNNDIFQSPYRPMYKWVEHLSSSGSGSGRGGTNANNSEDSSTDEDNNGDRERSSAEQNLVGDDLAIRRRPPPPSAMNFSLSPLDENQNQIVPVCFGGRFMTTLHQIVNNSNVNDWTPMLESLSRGDNIEEGHYMERMWAALLSKPIPLREQHEFLRRKVRHFKKHTIIGLISVLPDGVPSFPNIMIKESCINCRLHVQIEEQDKIFVNNTYFESKKNPEDDGIDPCRMIDHGDTFANETMTALDRCYTLMALRECRKNDKYERRFRLQADQCRKAKKILLKRQEIERFSQEQFERLHESTNENQQPRQRK